MGTIANICKKDERTDLKGEYVSTKSAAINNLEEPNIKNGKEGNFSFKDKEIGNSSVIDNSNYDKNYEFSIVHHNRIEDYKNESIIQSKDPNESKNLSNLYFI